MHRCSRCLAGDNNGRRRERLPSMEPTEFSPLRQAVQRRDADEVLSLLQDGANPNDVSDVAAGGWSVLASAIEDGAPAIVEALLRHGADPNFSSHGQRVLYRAVTLACTFASEEPDGALDPDDLRVIRMLLEYGADPSLANSDGKKPLDAVRVRCMETLKALADELEQRMT